MGNENKKNNNFKVIKNEELSEWDKEIEKSRSEFDSDAQFEIYKALLEDARKNPDFIDEIFEELDKEHGLDGDEDLSHYEMTEEGKVKYNNIHRALDVLIKKGIISDNVVQCEPFPGTGSMSEDGTFLKNKIMLNTDDIKQILKILKNTSWFEICCTNPMLYSFGVSNVYTKKSDKEE